MEISRWFWNIEKLEHHRNTWNILEKLCNLKPFGNFWQILENAKILVLSINLLEWSRIFWNIVPSFINGFEVPRFCQIRRCKYPGSNYPGNTYLGSNFQVTTSRVATTWLATTSVTTTRVATTRGKTPTRVAPTRRAATWVALGNNCLGSNNYPQIL